MKATWSLNRIIPQTGEEHAKNKEPTNPTALHTPIQKQTAKHCLTLLWDALLGHSCRARSCGTVSWELAETCQSEHFGRVSSKSHTSSLQSERFARDALHKSGATAPKTSVLYETCSKSHASSLPNNPRRAFRTRHPPKVNRGVLSERTHQAALPRSFAIPAPENRSRQSKWHSDIRLR